MRKTDIEIAADAIKYCRSELSKFRRLILQAECEELRRQPSDEMIKQWRYEAARLEFVLGEREEMPLPYWRMN